MRRKIDIRKLLFTFLLLLCTLFFSVVMTNCGGYDNGTSSNFNGNDNMNDNNGPY
ncbi:hypothetical protein L0244_05920 [bacterium]|nr:hypothetical protein [bacterium]MCI0612508.1 hypothetical protein [bacterium]